MERISDISRLKEIARNHRREILETITGAGSGHPGGSLSCIDLLVTLYLYKMNHKPAEPKWPQRDRFILSKGHAAPAIYVTLANCGYFQKEELAGFRKLGSILQGHIYTGVPGVELSTGSLGQGLSVACGIALAGKLKRENFNVYCLLGDGEIQEGAIWEAAMTAPHHKLDNLCVILDRNNIQQNGPVEEIKKEEPLSDKWKSFGWNVMEINGHDFAHIIMALDEFDSIRERPTFIKANTVKGKGVSFMEGKSQWHGKAPSEKELEQALKELGF